MSGHNPGEEATLRCEDCGQESENIAEYKWHDCGDEPAPEIAFEAMESPLYDFENGGRSGRRRHARTSSGALWRRRSRSRAAG